MENIVALQPFASPEALLGIVFNPGTIFAVLGLLLLTALALTFILLHHWRAYTIRREPLRRVAAIYLVGNGVLAAGMIIFGILGLTG